MPGLQGLALKTVSIPKSLIAELVTARSENLPYETGGFLLGQRSAGDIEIVSATRQGRDDKATPSSFERNDPSHHLIAFDRWKRDAGRTGYAGDWHSHPTGDGSPSSTDRRAWSTLYDHSKGPIVGVILGETERLRVFRCAKRMGMFQVTECVLASEDDMQLCYVPKGADAYDRHHKLKE